MNSNITIFKVFQSNKHQTSVRFVCSGKNIYTCYAQYVLYARHLRHFFGQLIHYLNSTVGRSIFRQAYSDNGHTLVFTGNEGRRSHLSQSTNANYENQQTTKHQFCSTNAQLNIFNVFAKHSFEPCVKAMDKFTNRTFNFFIVVMLFQKQCTKSRSQRQRNYCGKQHGYGYGNRKLFVQFAYDTASKRGGNEYRSQYECNRNYRTRYFAHRTISCFFRIHAIFLNMIFYCFYYYDSIVYYQTDCQNHSKCGQGVNSKAKEYEGSKGTNQGYRNCQQRNQSCTPVTQEDKYYENYQH